MKLFSLCFHSSDSVCARKKIYSTGFSLIEILVTMVILSFGLLGVAGLLVSGVSNAASSEAMSKASQLSADMADRIRANPAGARSSSSQYITTYADDVPIDLSTIANQDKKVWLEALARELPQGDGKITYTTNGGDFKVEIEVRWSQCLGTMNDVDRSSCTDNAAAAFKTFKFELHL